MMQQPMTQQPMMHAAVSDATARGAAIDALMIQQQIHTHTCPQVVLDYVPMI